MADGGADRTAPRIRSACTGDAEAVLDIYAPLVETSTISFETVAPSRAEVRARIEAALASHAWLVAERGGEIAGYAYAGAHRARAAYHRSVEVSAYVHERHRGHGVGGALYRALLDALRARDFHAAFAGIALPNEPSVRLHRSVGFTEVGVFEQVGFKFDAWHDVSWWQRLL